MLIHLKSEESEKETKVRKVEEKIVKRSNSEDWVRKSRYTGGDYSEKRC